MNWRGGFVRAWVVLTVLWVLLCLVLASGPGEYDDLILQYGSRNWVSLYLDRIIARLSEPSRWFVLLGPPVVILCFGALVAWVMAGFRQRKSN